MQDIGRNEDRIPRGRVMVIRPECNPRYIGIRPLNDTERDRHAVGAENAGTQIDVDGIDRVYFEDVVEARGIDRMIERKTDVRLCGHCSGSVDRITGRNRHGLLLRKRRPSQAENEQRKP